MQAAAGAADFRFCGFDAALNTRCPNPGHLSRAVGPAAAAPVAQPPAPGQRAVA